MWRSTAGRGSTRDAARRRRSGVRQLLLRRLDGLGQPLDPEEPVVAVEGPELGAHAVDWNGSVYLAVWSIDEQIYGRRFAADLARLDPEPFTIMEGLSPDVADPLTGMGIPARTFRTLFAAEPALRQLVVSSFARRLDETMTLVSEVASARVDQRLAQLLLRRWEASGDGGGAVRFTHHELAGELGTAREIASRILRSFADQRVVSLGRGTARVLDAERLRERAPG